jgi:hypothetical protein
MQLNLDKLSKLDLGFYIAWLEALTEDLPDNVNLLPVHRHVLHALRNALMRVELKEYLFNKEAA